MVNGRWAFILLVAISATVLALPARAEVKDVSASGFTVENLSLIHI